MPGETSWSTPKSMTAEETRKVKTGANLNGLTDAPDNAFMVGDQLDRDIAPAKAAGVNTIYFPGGFQPRWAPDLQSIRPDHVIASFAEVPNIVLNFISEGKRSKPL